MALIPYLVLERIAGSKGFLKRALRVLWDPHAWHAQAVAQDPLN
jgi:hypothetical protein